MSVPHKVWVEVRARPLGPMQEKTLASILSRVQEFAAEKERNRKQPVQLVSEQRVRRWREGLERERAKARARIQADKEALQQQWRENRAQAQVQRRNINNDSDSDSDSDVVIVENPPEVIDLLSD